MNGSDLAALISAIAFAVLVIALVLLLLKVSKMVDIASATIRETADSLVPLLDELTEATQTTNRQLEKIDVITDSVVETTTNISSLVNRLGETFGGPLMRVGALVRGISELLGKSKK